MDNYLSLQNKTIILTRALNQQGPSRRIFENYGAKVLDLPALVIGPPDDFSSLDNALNELASFHWIIFSSSNGIESVEKRLQQRNLSLSNVPKSLKFAVVGRKTADYLNQIGIHADFIPPEFVADSLINNFPVSGMGLRILIPRVQSGGRQILAQSFRDSGANVVEVSAYQSYCPQKIPEITADALNNLDVDAITFTSSKIVLNSYKLIKDLFGDQLENKLNKVKLISIGPQTSLSCKKYFNRVDKEAIPYNIDGLVKACFQSIS